MLPLAPDAPIRGVIVLSLLADFAVCVRGALVFCLLFVRFFRAPIVVAPPPLSLLRFAFPAPSPPSLPPVLSSPAPFLSLCGGFAGARTQAPSVYARMLLCFGAGTQVHSSSPFPVCFLFSCIVPPFVPSLVACTLCCLCLPLVLSPFVCLGHAHKLLLLRMHFATILVFHSTFVLHSCRTPFMCVTTCRHRGERRGELATCIPAYGVRFPIVSFFFFPSWPLCFFWRRPSLGVLA